MAITVTCAQCGQGYRVKEHLAGKSARCKKCGHAMPIPALQPPPQCEPTESGGMVLRHQPRQAEFEPAFGDPDAIERIGAHIEKHLGKVEGVFHEVVSDLVHLDVHWVGPSEQRPFHTLITTGMSDRPMTVPEGTEELAFAELLICLPSSWPLSHEAFQDERNYWPVRWLKQLARLPHEYQTWLGLGHTVPNGDPAEPFADNTKMCCWLIVPPVLVDDDFSPLAIDEEKQVHFYAAIPLYREEMEFKLKRGLEDLVDRLSAEGVTEVLDLQRKNTCKRGLWP